MRRFAPRRPPRLLPTTCCVNFRVSRAPKPLLGRPTHRCARSGAAGGAQLAFSTAGAPDGLLGRPQRLAKLSCELGSAAPPSAALFFRWGWCKGTPMLHTCLGWAPLGLQASPPPLSRFGFQPRRAVPGPRPASQQLYGSRDHEGRPLPAPWRPPQGPTPALRYWGCCTSRLALPLPSCAFSPPCTSVGSGRSGQTLSVPRPKP